MKAHEIRDALLLQIDRTGNPLVFAEMCYLHGVGRFDLVAIYPDRFHVYEIKGEGDSLRSLPAQIRKYRTVADHLDVVIDESLFAGVEHGSLAGHSVVRDGVIEREGWTDKYVCSACRLAPYNILSILWESEIRDFVKQHCEANNTEVPRGPRGGRVSAETLRQLLSVRCSIAEIYRYLYDTLAARGQRWSRQPLIDHTMPAPAMPRPAVEQLQLLPA